MNFYQVCCPKPESPCKYNALKCCPTISTTDSANYSSTSSKFTETIPTTVIPDTTTTGQTPRTKSYIRLWILVCVSLIIIILFGVFFKIFRKILTKNKTNIAANNCENSPLIRSSDHGY